MWGFLWLLIDIFYAMAQTVITFNLSDGNEKNKRISSTIEYYSRWYFL
jgi:hypothetical protein